MLDLLFRKEPSKGDNISINLLGEGIAVAVSCYHLGGDDYAILLRIA